MQCDVEVRDNIDLAMFKTVCKKKKSTTLTLFIVAVITLPLKEYSSIWKTLACSTRET